MRYDQFGNPLGEENTLLTGSKSSNLRQRIDSRKAVLEAELKELNEVLEVLDKNPGIDKVLDLLSSQCNRY